MSGERPKSFLDRFLGLFTEVRGGEGLTALLLTANIFLILTSYYIMKPVREALILASPGGAELKAYMSAGQTVLLLFTVPLYARLASRMPRRRLLNSVTVFFVACLGLFYLLAQANHVLKDFPWREQDVISSFAGIRTLPAATGRSSEVTRDLVIEEPLGNLLLRAGGKLTSARVDAARVVDRVLELSHLAVRPAPHDGTHRILGQDPVGRDTRVEHLDLGVGQRLREGG